MQSGNRSVYQVNRIARDRPDVLARMKVGEFETVRDAARAAGYDSYYFFQKGQFT